MPAPKGNTNALKHGFYATRFTADETARLDDQKPADVQAEIALLRVCIDRLTTQLQFDELPDPPAIEETSQTIGSADRTRDDHYLKQLNTLSLMTQSLATLARTQHMIHGKSGDVVDSILKALEEIRIEMGI